MKKLIAYSIFFGLTAFVFAQNTRNVEVPKPPKSQYQEVKKKKKNNLFRSTKKTGVAEFRSRLKKVYKQRAKEEKLSNKPQYSNPTYFGHKRPPKKRQVGKQKFCTVCRIKH